MDTYTFLALTSSILAAIILMGLTLHWIYTINGSRIIEETANRMKSLEPTSSAVNLKPMSPSKRISSMKTTHVKRHSKSMKGSDQLAPNIKITITVLLMLFTLVACVYIVFLVIFNVFYKEYQHKLLYILPLRMIPMSCLFVFLFKRLRGIFNGTVYSINKPIYKRTFIAGLTVYYILFIILYIVVIITVWNQAIFKLGSLLIILIAIFAGFIEVIISCTLMYIALKRLKLLRIKTINAVSNDGNDVNRESIRAINTNNALKYIANKIFISTIVAALSSQIMVITWGIESKLFVNKPPIIQINIDAIINSFCAVLSVHYYNKHYKILCRFCRMCCE